MRVWQPARQVAESLVGSDQGLDGDPRCYCRFMGWLIVGAGLIGVVLAAVAASSRQRRAYLGWMSGWVGRDQSGSSVPAPTVELVLTEPMPGAVVGRSESEYSGDGFIALVESGVRLTESPGSATTSWGAFWHDVTGYDVVGGTGVLQIEIAGRGCVHVDAENGAVQDQWETVLGSKGVRRR